MLDDPERGLLLFDRRYDVPPKRPWWPLWLLAVASFFLLISTVTFCHGDEPSDSQNELTRWGTPEGTVVIDIPGRLCHAFDGRSKTCRWTLERLDHEYLQGNADRGDEHFYEDHRLPVELRLPPSLFRNSGYDRGHTAPAEDHAYSQENMHRTFCTSLVFFQDRELNRGPWRMVEDSARKLATPGRSVWIVTVLLFESENGSHAIRVPLVGNTWVPSAVAKSVLIVEHGASEPSDIFSWLAENETPRDGLNANELIISVDAIEHRAGLDLWANVPNPQQAAMESRR